MLKIPKKINVFGKSHKIILCKNLITPNGEAVSGCFTPDHATIHISTSLNPTQDDILLTMVHELGHALINRISICQAGMPMELEEILVDSFAKLMTETFKLKFK